MFFHYTLCFIVCFSITQSVFINIINNMHDLCLARCNGALILYYPRVYLFFGDNGHKSTMHVCGTTLIPISNKILIFRYVLVKCKSFFKIGTIAEWS